MSYILVKKKKPSVFCWGSYATESNLEPPKSSEARPWTLSPHLSKPAGLGTFPAHQFSMAFHHLKNFTKKKKKKEFQTFQTLMPDIQTLPHLLSPHLKDFLSSNQAGQTASL